MDKEVEAKQSLPDGLPDGVNQLLVQLLKVRKTKKTKDSHYKGAALDRKELLQSQGIAL